MPGDFRVNVDFQDHPKIIKLVAQYGNDGLAALMRIWAFAAKYRHTGSLTKMTPIDIALAAKWGGDATEFVAFLVADGLLDKRRNGQYSIHGWAERNGFIFHYPQRRKQAKNAAKQKHTNGRNNLRPAESENQQANKPAPSPTPTPTPTPNHKEEMLVDEIIQDLNARLMGAGLSGGYRPGSKKTRESVNARLREGFTVDDFRLVNKWKIAEWWRDEKMSKFLRPATLYSPSKFESYLQYAKTEEAKRERRQTSHQFPD